MEALEELFRDPTLLFFVVLALAVILFVVLVVVIASIRIRKYKVGYLNAQVSQKVATQQLTRLEQEHAALHEHMMEYSQRVEAFDTIKQRLQVAQKSLLESESRAKGATESLSTTQKELDSLQNYYKRLLESYERMEQERNSLRQERERLQVKLQMQTKERRGV